MSRPALRSMTGYCSHSLESARGRFRIELKTLNHRFIDLKIRLPREHASLEVQVRSLLQSRIKRGSVDLRVDFEADTEQNTQPPELNLTLAAHYFEALKKIQSALGLTDSPKTIEIAQFPEVLRRPNSTEVPNWEVASASWPILEKGLHDAIDRLDVMRLKEGSILHETLERALTFIATTTTTLRGKRSELVIRERALLQERVQKIFEAHPLPEPLAQAWIESRVTQELALLLERGDVEEELVRLGGHVEHFRAALQEGSPIGKKLEFLLQEMHREINTLGSKSQDLGISENVVALKLKLEQIREQVMNLE